MEGEAVIEKTKATEQSLRLTFGPCLFCGEGDSDVRFEPGGVSYHSTCLTCPECKGDFIVWQGARQPALFRCLGCLHGWERTLQVVPIEKV